ncbi:MAG: hypothetical protein R2716_11650 [Microthrixaceae bacterium]
MVILDVDHPDVEEFIWCKAIEERKATCSPMPDSTWTSTIPSRFSTRTPTPVRLSDSTMQSGALGPGVDHDSAAPPKRSCAGCPRRSILRQIAAASWECADPGVQFDTTINDWNTTPEAGRIEASNPVRAPAAPTTAQPRLPNLLSYLEEDGTFDDGGLHPLLSCAGDRPRTSSWVKRPTLRPRRSHSSPHQARHRLGYTRTWVPTLMAQGLPYDSEDGQGPGRPRRCRRSSRGPRRGALDQLAE